MRRSFPSQVLLFGLLCLFRADAPILAAPDQVVVVPFDFSRHEIVAQVQIDGQGPFSMLLDTGTNPSVIDLTVARRIGLHLDPVGHSGDGGGTRKSLAYQTALPSVEIGSFEAANVSTAAMDLSGLSRKFGRPIQGVLGDSLFTDQIVQFDYPHRVARFFARSPYAGQAHRPNTPQFAAFPFRHTDCVQFDGVSVNGTQVRANLDTGSNGEFSLTPQAVRRLGLQRDALRAKKERGAGFNGAYASRIGTVRCVQVGPTAVLSPPVTFWMPGTGHDDAPYDVNIGNVFWKDFVVTIDYRAQIITLERP